MTDEESFEVIKILRLIRAGGLPTEIKEDNVVKFDVLRVMIDEGFIRNCNRSSDLQRSNVNVQITRMGNDLLEAATGLDDLKFEKA